MASLQDAEVLASSRQLDIRRGEAVFLTTFLPVEAMETLRIKDATGSVVRTLVSERRSPGLHTDCWDGTAGEGARLRDDQYRWIADFEAGTERLTIDRSYELDGDYETKSHPVYSSMDPFDNKPLRFSHEFERPGEVVLVFSRRTYYVIPKCDPPEFFCRFLEGFQPAGISSYEWAGVDEAGAYRPDIHAIFVVSNHSNLSSNAIVVSGGHPSIRDVTVAPPLYRPYTGDQEVRFHLDAYHDEHLSATITFTSHETRAILRTLVLPDVAPGPVSVPWDGRAESGLDVLPGGYTVRVSVTDSLGQRAAGEILTRVVY